MSRRRRVLLGACAAVAAVLGLLTLGAERPLRGFAGYAAKIYAGAVFLQGRTPESVADEEFAPERSAERVIRPLLSIEVDRARGAVTATLLGRSAVVVHRPGLGGVLLPDGAPPDFDLDLAARAAAPASPASAPDPRPWPLGDADAAGPREGFDVARLDATIDAAFSEPASGPRRRTRAVIVLRRGRVVAERYAPGFGPATPFLGWSMAKSVTAALVGLRVDEGLVDPDRPPAWPGYPAGDPRAAITWRDLLRMSSGLAWAEDYFAAESDPVGMLFAERDAGAFAATKPLATPPGATFLYSSGATNVVARALRALHRDEADRFSWPRRALFEPLGMRGAVFEPDASGTFVGSSFLYAPARDWARFALLYAGEGVFAGRRVLSAAWVRACLEPAPAAPRGEYGLHWWLNRGPGGDATRRRFPRLPAEFFAAEGYEGQIAAVDPTRDVVVVRLGVTKDRAAFDAREFVADVLAAFPPR